MNGPCVCARMTGGVRRLNGLTGALLRVAGEFLLALMVNYPARNVIDCFSAQSGVEFAITSGLRLSSDK